MLIRIVFIFCISVGTLKAQMNFTPEYAVDYFLKTLSSDEHQKTVYAFEDTMRTKWTNLPVGLVPRAGIQYGSLSDKSRQAWHRVQATILSSQGYLKTTSIMQLDDILNELYKSYLDGGKINQQTYDRIRNLNWAHGNYYISVYGLPYSGKPWSVNFGGHHIALTYLQDKNGVSMTPYFIGTDPGEVKTDKYAGLRVLSKEEDYGFMLINMLSEQQKSMTILNEKIPGDIITSPHSSQRIDKYNGISADKLSAEQKIVLDLIIEEYVHNLNHSKAHQLMSKIKKKGYKKIYFAWIGNTSNDKPHYYIINSPDFLIEYDNVGFNNDGNHIHAILREKGNDFGEDLLKRHYLTVKH